VNITTFLSDDVFLGGGKARWSPSWVLLAHFAPAELPNPATRPLDLAIQRGAKTLQMASNKPAILHKETTQSHRSIKRFFLP